MKLSRKEVWIWRVKGQKPHLDNVKQNRSQEGWQRVDKWNELLLCSTWSSWAHFLDNIWINRKKNSWKKQNKRKLQSIGLAPTHPPSFEKFAASRISCLLGIRRYLNSSKGRRWKKRACFRLLHFHPLTNALLSSGSWMARRELTKIHSDGRPSLLKP